jgi:hypothetical protein
MGDYSVVLQFEFYDPVFDRLKSKKTRAAAPVRRMFVVTPE